MDRTVSLSRSEGLTTIAVSDETGETYRLSMPNDLAMRLGAQLLALGEEPSEASKSLFQRVPFMALTNPVLEARWSDNGQLNVAVAHGNGRPIHLQFDGEHCDYWIARLQLFLDERE